MENQQMVECFVGNDAVLLQYYNCSSLSLLERERERRERERERERERRERGEERESLLLAHISIFCMFLVFSLEYKRLFSKKGGAFVYWCFLGNNRCVQLAHVIFSYFLVIDKSNLNTCQMC